MPSLVMVGNTQARQTHAMFEKARGLFEARGFRVDEAALVEGHVPLQKYVKRAVKRAKLVVVCGGDGTLTRAVGSFAYRKCVLGVLPAGTGNSFALTLGIESDVEKAVEAIVAGRVAKVDLGMVDKTYFANFATVGLSADIGRATSRELKSKIGAAAYALAGIGPTLTSPAFSVRLRAKAHKLEFPTHQIIVANGRFFGHKPLAPEATIDDGLLTVFATTDTGGFDAAKTYAALGLGLQHYLPAAHSFSTPEVVVRAKPRQNVDIDGDAYGKTPVRFRVAREALRVMVPQSFSP